jgi:hypothetical protein
MAKRPRTEGQNMAGSKRRFRNLDNLRTQNLEINFLLPLLMAFLLDGIFGANGRGVTMNGIFNSEIIQLTRFSLITESGR